MSQPTEPSGFRSIVSCRGDGLDNVWSVAEKLDLTYCFGTFSTSNLRENVESIMPRATMDWERAGDVNFIHVPMSAEECNCIFPEDAENNDACETNSDRARLRIREADLSVGHPARAGFPGNPVLELKVDKAADNTSEKLHRLITHELGHVLGFMHEHYRYDASNTLSDCSNSDPWRGVTDPDAASIMGYGHCAGIEGASSPDIISALDRQGAAYIYNLPRNEFPSYTSESVDDILWFIPSSHKYTLWRATFDPQNAISFSDTDESFCGVENPNNPGDCTGGHTFNKPIPIALTTTRLADVISYGPGSKPDSMLLHTPVGPLEEKNASIDEQPFDLPIVGHFMGSGATEQLWWIRPGNSSDPLGQLMPNQYIVPDSDFSNSDVKDSWFQPIVGLWANKGSMRHNSQIIWHRPKAGFFLTYQSAQFNTMFEEPVSPACFFSGLLQPIALRGDFDGDNQMEVFWVSLGNGQHVLWRDPARMWDPDTNSPCSDPSIVQVLSPHGNGEAFFKPFVGDFDGDDSDDIYWYSPDNSGSEIWLDVGAPGGPTIVSPVVDGTADPTIGDLTPFVGDFNGDLCDDILWFSPDKAFSENTNTPTSGDPTDGQELGSSPLWRSLCSSCSTAAWSGFTAQTEVSPPIGAYPVGYDPRSAGRRADLDPCTP